MYLLGKKRATGAKTDVRLWYGSLRGLSKVTCLIQL